MARRLLLVLLAAVVLAGGAWYVLDDDALAGSQRVDDRDRAGACDQGFGEPSFCLGSIFPLTAPNVARDRLLIVWQGEYEPGRLDLYGRLLDGRGRPAGKTVVLSSLPSDGDVLVQLRSRAGGGWTLWWRGRRHFYSARLSAEGQRRGGRIGRDPGVVSSRRGQRVTLRSGRVVEVYETLDGQVRSELLKR